jgi:hypothetical protein
MPPTITRGCVRSTSMTMAAPNFAKSQVHTVAMSYFGSM